MALPKRPKYISPSPSENGHDYRSDSPLENVLHLSTPVPQKNYFKGHVCRPDCPLENVQKM